MNARDDLIENIRAILQGAISPGVQTPAVETIKDRLEKFIKESMARRQTVIRERRPDGGPEHCPHGGVVFAYAIEADFQPPSLEKLVEIMRLAQGHETGWPSWWVPTKDGITPYPLNGNVECSLIHENWNDPGYADFWLVSPRGMAFLWRGYQEDGSDKFPPGAFLDLTIPIWRVGETLLHASRFVQALIGGPAMIFYRVQWSGLSGRALTSWAEPRRMLHIDRKAQQDILEGVAAGHVRIAHEREVVRETARRIEADLEAWLFGRKKVGA